MFGVVMEAVALAGAMKQEEQRLKFDCPLPSNSCQMLTAKKGWETTFPDCMVVPALRPTRPTNESIPFNVSVPLTVEHPPHGGGGPPDPEVTLSASMDVCDQTRPMLGS